MAAFLGGLLEDCARALSLARAAGCEGEETKLLQPVVEQDVDREGPDGSPRVRQGVAKGRMPSVNDSEMRHGHKSNGKWLLTAAVANFRLMWNREASVA